MNEHEISTDSNDAIAAIRSRVNAAEDVVDDRTNTCPVKFLGHSSGSYFFVSPVGQQRIMRYNEFTWNGILSLFEGDLDWLEKHFPKTGRGDKYLQGFDLDSVTHFLMNSCCIAGLYDDSIHIRRTGIWRDDSPPDGGLPRLIAHCGDVLFINGQKSPVGQRIGSALYESRPSIGHIADQAASLKDAQYLLDTLRMWKFSRGELDVQLLAGWIAQGMLGAAPSWRVHMMVTGGFGSGKSWMTHTVKNALGAGAHEIKNNFTEAHLRQSLNNESRVMILDEAEHEENGNSRISRVIELLRHMSGSDGVRGGRGSPGGQSQSFSVTGCAYLSSILHVPLKPADKSRIIHLQLQEISKDIPPEHSIELEKRIKNLATLSPLYRRRMIDGWMNFNRALEMYRAAFMKAGLNSRAADQLGTLYAGRSVLFFDIPPCSDSIDEDILQAHAIIHELKEQIEENNEGLLCLNHLYSSIAEIWRNGERSTLGQVLADAINKKQKCINKNLGPYGLYYNPPAPQNDGKAQIIVANNSAGLEKIFAGTRWASGVWAQALSYAGCKKTGTFRFAGMASRGHQIPENLWPEVDE